MTTSTVNHTDIMQKVALLPPETLPALDEFIALLERWIIEPENDVSEVRRQIIGEDSDALLSESP